MYRHRKKFSAKLQARRRSVLDGEPRPGPIRLPDLRREIIIRDHDFGLVEHHIKLFRSRRVDCYRVEVDGVQWKLRVGWSRALEVVRKAFIRVGAQ